MHESDPGAAPTPQEHAAEPDPEALGQAASPEAEAGGLRADLAALVDDARTYAEVEIAFQKTRAALAGKAVGRALTALVLALLMLNLALIALAVGVMIALAPLVTIWGAIAIVVGVLLLGVGGLLWAALRDGRLLAALFGPGEAP